ncbi:MAG: high-affinity nickel-transport family protein [Candidatus Eisenbacteria bacterium]
MARRDPGRYPPAMNLLALLGLGLVLGLRHAADPDHVVAVTAITARTRRLGPAAWLGVVWGLGHTLTLFAVGSLIILFNLVVPPRLGLTFEFAVAIALVVVGLLNLRGQPAQNQLDDSTRGLPAGRAFGVGLVHGLAGSAAVALLVLATVHDPLWACGYLLVFGAGTLIGMMLITTGVAAPLGLVSRRWNGFPQLARVGSGLLSLLFGVWLIYQVGWLEGLFGAVPRWTPH